MYEVDCTALPKKYVRILGCGEEHCYVKEGAGEEYLDIAFEGAEVLESVGYRGGADTEHRYFSFCEDTTWNFLKETGHPVFIDTLILLEGAPTSPPAQDIQGTVTR